MLVTMPAKQRFLLRRPGGISNETFTQPAMDAASNAASRQRRSDAMEWLLLEALVALSLAVFIVWFTMGGRRKNPPRPPQDPIDRDGADGGRGEG
jgi:hypothetical protein